MIEKTEVILVENSKQWIREGAYLKTIKEKIWFFLHNTYNMGAQPDPFEHPTILAVVAFLFKSSYEPHHEKANILHMR